MKQVYDHLYIGDVNDADNPNKTQDIDRILNVSGAMPDGEVLKNKHYTAKPLKDNENNTDQLIKETIKEAERQIENGDLLIHCGLGVSRSVAIAAAVMSLENRRRVRENISRIKKIHPAANPPEKLVDQVSRITSDLYND